MHTRFLFQTTLFTIMLTSFLLSACNTPALSAVPSANPAIATPTPSKPDWFAIALTDARTGETFTINDFAGKVVLIQTMSEQCYQCALQQDEMRTLSTLLDNPDGLVSICLDVDSNEDQPSLKKYVDYFGFEWHFAVAPLGVEHALGNLYSAEYLNPPLNPMLVIDRKGKVYGLPYGIKSANALKNTIAPYFSQ